MIAEHEQPTSDANTNPDIKLTKTVRRSRRKLARAKLEAQVLSLRTAGATWQAIADELGMGSHSTACSIFRKAVSRLPQLTLDEQRRLQDARLEELFLNLHKPKGGVREGNPRGIEVAVQVLEHKAKLHTLYPQPAVNLPGGNINVTVVDRIEFIALQSPDQRLDNASGAAAEAVIDSRAEPAAGDQGAGSGGSDRNRQDVVRPDMGVGESSAAAEH